MDARLFSRDDYANESVASMATLILNMMELFGFGGARRKKKCHAAATVTIVAAPTQPY